jgi:hypothetical protein
MADEDSVPPASITIFGGKKSDVSQAVMDTLQVEKSDYYQTWLSLGVMKRLGFLFEGGVESAGGIGEILCMFIVLFLTLAMFFFWQLAALAIIAVVLAIFSGGDAVKFVRATYVTAPLESLDPGNIEAFVEQQTMLGRYVQIHGDAQRGIIASSSNAAYLFKRGIHFSLLVATSFIVVEVIYWLFNRHWLSGLDPINRPGEWPVLLVFALLFLTGIIVMDIGVILRVRLRRRLHGEVRVVD